MTEPTTRRQFISVASVAIAAPGLLSSPAAESSGDTWLRRHAQDLPRLACELADWEGRAAKHEYPTVWRRIRYITTIQFSTSLSLIVGFGLAGKTFDYYTQTRAALIDDAVPILASGWSQDRRVWSLFVEADVAPIRELMGTIAPPADFWEKLSRWNT